jgi:iron(III) transport system ATP-binding protein
MNPVGVRVENISKRFSHPVKGEIYAARDVSLKVEPGEFLTLLGPSGCGKTTTLRMIAGFEKPDTGSILIGDKDVTRLSSNKRNIGFVFQNYALFPHLSVFENIAYGLEVRGKTRAEIQREVREVLDLVGLSGFEKQFPAQMSGGEQQRVAVARAIIIKPQVLLFDEPLSNLDAKLRIQMRVEIHELQRRLSITTVYVTHDQEEAMAVSDRICVMNQGELIQDGSAEDLYYRPANPFVAQFIGRVNMVKARVLSVLEDQLSVEALGAKLLINRGLRRPSVGSDVTLVLRPESVDLTRPDGSGAAAVGRVVSRTFLGEKIEYILECGGARLQVVNIDRGRGSSPAEGETVALKFFEDTIAVLEDSVQ